MDTSTLMALLGFLTLGGNVIVSIWNYRNEIRKTNISAGSSDFQAANNVSQAWKPLTDEMRGQLADLRAQMAELKAADEAKTKLLITAVTGVNILIQQLKARGIKPDWTMPPELAALISEIPQNAK